MIPSLDMQMQEQLQEQMRLQMVESFRQEAALQAMVATVVHAIKNDDEAIDPRATAAKAKRLADELTNAMFPE